MQPIIVRSLVALTLIASGSVLAQTPPTSGADSTRKPGPTVIPAAAPAEGEVTHVVKKGDTLWDIARAYLKDPFRWPEVFRRNTDVVENPHWIYPGEVIRIPQSEVRAEVLGRLAAKPAPTAAAPVATAPVATALEPTVFSTRPALVSDRLQSNGQVLGRELAGVLAKSKLLRSPTGRADHTAQEGLLRRTTGRGFRQRQAISGSSCRIRFSSSCRAVTRPASATGMLRTSSDQCWATNRSS